MRCARPAISKRALSLALLALAGCGVLRPTDFSPICPSYEATIRPIVEARCSSCHSDAKAEGGYRVGAHAQTVSRSDDGTPRVAPGDNASPLLAAARGELPGHTAIDAKEVAVLQSWVVRCRGAPAPHQFHPKGWATSTDPEQFHGVALRASRYDFTECKKCHGEDLRGGAAKVDCNTCHLEGPQQCNTCHGDKDSAAPPRDLKGVRLTTSLGVGAHRAHESTGCVSCHLDVKSPTDEGHYRAAGIFLTPVEVRPPSGPTGTAKWDRSKATCANVYCHAPSNTDTAPSRSDPVWTKKGITCGSCHGAPPSNHSSNQCELCHGAAYADGGVDPTLHLNGKVDLRNGGESCDACHSGPDSPTFVDLKGRRADAGVQTVGAHDAHLHANRLRGPITCNECHLVPGSVGAVGHLDSPPPAEVFPAFDPVALAWKQGAAPTYAGGTCGSVYCHGGGDYGHPDNAPGLQRNPSWNAKSDQAACGTCHGLPPQDGTLGHNAAISVPCNVCHGGSVWPDGGIVFTALPDGGLTSKHLDGKITGSQ